MTTQLYDSLMRKMQDRTARIGVVGLGYVGLPLLKTVLDQGFKAYGFDIDPKKLAGIEQGRSYLEHINIDLITEAIKHKNCDLSVKFDLVAKCDLVILCVPTPLNKYREPDLSYVDTSLLALMPYLKEGQALSLESTTYPGTTEEKILKPITEAGFSVGDDFFLIYSPEREDPGNTDFGFSSIPRVVSGITNRCCDIAELFYSTIVGSAVRVSSTKTAEMTKILENTYRSVNIALVNELKVVADAMGIDIFEVIEAAASKPFGYQAFYPGPGLGGHCIPIDPFYLTWKAREYGLHTKFIELAGEVNTAMPTYVVDKISYGLNAIEIPINGTKILVLGVAYKKNIGDVRESPGIEIVNTLKALGANVSYHDPHVSSLPKMRKYNLHMNSINFDRTTVVSDYTCCVIVTDHDDVDYELLHDCKLVVDTRGRLDKSKFKNLIQA